MPSPGKRTLLTTWMFALLLCAVGWLGGSRAFALDPNKEFEHYVSNIWSIQDGLPQISALAITQDRTGYIWVGTQNGLARFDGVRFTTYTPDSEPALPGIYIRALLLDRDGILWIGTYKGLARAEGGRFQSVPAADTARHPTLDVNALAQTADGSIVAATSDGVFRVNRGHLVELPNGPKPALSLLPRGDGLWVGGSGTVLRMDQAQIFNLPLPQEAVTAGVAHLAEAQGRIWAGTSQGLYSRLDDTWVRFDEDASLARSPINSILRDHDDNLWVSTNSGFARLRDAHLAERIDETNLRATRSVISSFEDREGNLWLGSQLEGLARLWNGWTRRYSTSDGLNDRIVWSLSRAPDGTLWVGTNDGLSTFDGKRFTPVAPGSALPHPQAYNLLAEADQLWVGTRRGLAIWRDGRVETPPLYAPMASAQINGIWRDRNGDLWFPTTEGLFFQHNDSPLRRFAQPEGLADRRIRTIIETRNHRILVGTQGGLYEKNGDRFTPVPGLPPGLDVTTIYELPSGAIVIGVITESIYVFDGRIWAAIGQKQGLPSNAPFFQTMDDRGYLWIAGIRGVERVPITDLERFAHGEIHAVRGEMLLNERGDRNAGQQGFCCNGAGLAKGFIDGHVLWLPSRDGVVVLDTHGIVKNTITPAVVIERIKYLGAWHAVENSGAHVELAHLELEPRARDLAFDFTAPSFQDPHSILIHYRLVGYDRDWHDLEDVTRRSVNYTNLPPGDYTFEAMASNNAGVWSPQTARFAFGIRPWFYETKLFYVLLALLLAMLVYAGYRRQRQLHIAQRDLLEQQVRDRTQELHTANERLENVSQTDPLTGLRNRRYLDNQIPADLAFYDREQLRTGNYDQVILFALVDIDHFKQVNDTHGHKAGDRVLQQVAQVLTAPVRGGDYIVRWGGEEFLLMFRPMPQRYVSMIGERTRAAVADHVFDIGSGETLRLTCSVGIAEYPLFRNTQRRLGWEQMIELADGALRWVKQNGRNGWAAFRPTSITDLATLIRDLHSDPQKLLDQGQLQLLGSHIAPRSDSPEPPA
jgi:diguanylate cyclase (GGDEF)-like protein